VGGVTIDLRRMNIVEVATNGSFARVGGGAVTADVYSALDARNMSFVGGRVGSVGVGGFATGGGTSPLASRHGWAVNSIYEYEVSHLPCTCKFYFTDSSRSFCRTLPS
jgi:FAD/FMN-containing dehydrogenase